MKKSTLGILAHVDAGKTTLSESFLYLSNVIRKQGRVDHQDAFLDYDVQERQRGITIYAKQASFVWKDVQFTLLDTPGHVDFSTEMERVLPVLDYAIVIISAQEGIQAHTKTIWDLLKAYQVPAFVFVNKMDATYLTKEELLERLHAFDERMIEFATMDEAFWEQIALCSDALLEEYSETNRIAKASLQTAILQRQIFPVVFGSALRNQQVDALLDCLAKYTVNKPYPHTFGARVFKVTYEEDHTRLTHVKVTGGCLQAKQILDEGKIDQIRIYQGTKYRLAAEVEAGTICALKGELSLQAGDGLGYEEKKTVFLKPYMRYRLRLDKGIDSLQMMKHLEELKEEDPMLEIAYEERTDHIYVHLMGEVQMETLRYRIRQRYGIQVDFVEGEVLYKETITKTSEGVGHFEPLRHYAEVHVLLEPLSQGSGLVYENRCPNELLSKPFQNLVLSHLKEKRHKGVLIGAEITDMKITLVAGKANLKHTEGGDFRQATYRAVRHGLKMNDCILLEPYYRFTLIVPNEYVGKAIFDITQKHGDYEIVDEDDAMSTIQGQAPVILMQNYVQEVASYTKGQGRLTLELGDYRPCHNMEEVKEKKHYDSEMDRRNPTGSVFCAHGAGFYVPYDEVEHYMHIPYVTRQTKEETYVAFKPRKVRDEEVERVMDNTYGKVKTRLASQTLDEKEIRFQQEKYQAKKSCIIVDGYNMIHDWAMFQGELDNLDAARSKLIDLLSSYAGYRNILLILVFDAYKVKDGVERKIDNGSITIVYTKEAQTADSYIEKITHEYAKDYHVSVATSDAAEQVVIFTQHAMRISAKEFEKEVLQRQKAGYEDYQKSHRKKGNYPLTHLRKLNEEDS